VLETNTQMCSLASLASPTPTSYIIPLFMFATLFMFPMAPCFSLRYELAITDLNLFLEKLHSGDFNETLFVTHASRSDIVTGYLVYAATFERSTGQQVK